MKKICLNYHNLGYNPQFGINKVHPINFKNHIDIINNEIDKDPNLDVSITFDDGYENIYRFAFDYLNESRIKKKIIFPITDYIGRYNDWDSTFFLNRYKHLNQEQIKLFSDGDWEIGSHCATHRFLDSISSDEIRDELINSKDVIEQLTGKEVVSIAPPFGVLNQRVYDHCLNAGYKNIYVQKHDNIKESLEITIVRRNNIYSIDRSDSIIRKINSDRREKMKEDCITSLNTVTRFLNRFTSK